MTLRELGYNDTLEQFRKDEQLDTFEVGRITLEHKERYIVKNSTGEYDAELIGNLRFTAQDRDDFPAVGDWVAISVFNQDKALIHSILPRHTILERQAVGKHGQVQIIASNIDFALIIQAVDRDFNLNRMERYLTICHTAKVAPIIVLSKVDLIDQPKLSDILSQIEERHYGLHIITVNNQQAQGYQQLSEIIEKGKTYCLLGSSGVGKSTLANALSGVALMETGAISTSVNKGRHVTSHRELIVMKNGGILIDNPGMREVGITDQSKGLEVTFDDILAYAEDCKFSDCAHQYERGCAIIAAVENGEIDPYAYDNFLKMGRERSHFASSKQDKKKKDKDFGKMVKNVKKNRKNNKF
ncbi:MAG: ribosome small subunit-dependent GTPase A [Bacteroidales bacterium]|jgi:ribosome biogenesis GTPase|nr:ribosome small subunit-dependent GTPase A [Bacteroidales bacterium]